MITSETADTWLARMSDELRADLDNQLDEFALVGIYTGGVRVAHELHHRLGLKLPVGTLDISFYRDDFSHIGLHPQVKTSNIPFPIDGRVIALVDDVLYSGRTVRAALNTLFDYGRPARVLLCVMVERMGHELPIRADIKGEQMLLAPNQQVKLNADDLGMTVLDMETRS